MSEVQPIHLATRRTRLASRQGIAEELHPALSPVWDCLTSHVTAGNKDLGRISSSTFPVMTHEDG